MSTQMSSQRQIRYAELIRSLIIDCLLKEDFYDQSISSTSVIVSYVKMSKDLKMASVYLMPLGGENQQDLLENIKQKKHNQKCCYSSHFSFFYISDLSLIINNSAKGVDLHGINHHPPPLFTCL